MSVVENTKHAARKKTGKTDRSPYGECFAACLTQAIEITIKPYPQQRLRAVVELGHPNAGSIHVIFDERMRSSLAGCILDTVQVAPKEQYISLQAADLYAYLLYTNFRDKESTQRVSEPRG